MIYVSFNFKLLVILGRSTATLCDGNECLSIKLGMDINIEYSPHNNDMNSTSVIDTDCNQIIRQTNTLYDDDDATGPNKIVK